MNYILLSRSTLRPVLSRDLRHVRSINTRGVGSSRLHKRFPVATAVALGGSALIATYFFWPDTSRSAPTYENAKLSPTHFIPVTVTSSDTCSNPSTRLITLTVPRQSLPDIQELAFRPIWSIFIKDDDIQVERPYTPLEGIDKEGNMKFWIKRYPRGEVGRCIHSKNVGEQMEIRGPLKTWPWREDQWDEIVMVSIPSLWHCLRGVHLTDDKVSGGTGITPVYQLLHKELFSQTSKPSQCPFDLIPCDPSRSTGRTRSLTPRYL